MFGLGCWIATILFGIGAIIFFLLYRKDPYRDDMYMVFSVICIVIMVIIIIVAVCTVVDYYEFINYFEDLRAYYYALTSENLNDNLYNTADMINANETLIKYQASREFWGVFSLVPEKILEIAPIGTIQ